MDEKEFVDCALKELKECARANEITEIHEQTIGLVTSDIKRFYHEGWNLIDVVDYFKCQEDFAPELDEDVAINEMSRLRAKYEQKEYFCVNNDVPRIGEDVYVQSSFYIDHGEDDFQGGLCQISHVKMNDGYISVKVVERPGYVYTWEYLRENQEKWMKEYGTRRGRPDPDC